MDGISGLLRAPRKSGFLATHKSYLWRASSTASSYVFATCRVHCSKEVPDITANNTNTNNLGCHTEPVIQDKGEEGPC